MARLTITVEGEAEEVREALLRLFGGESGGLSAPEPDAPLGPQPAHEELPKSPPEPLLAWTREDLNRLWANLSDKARQVLAEVAQQPDGYRLEDLEQALGRNMGSIGGNLSSVGHAMGRLYRVGDSYTRPWPLVGDKYKRVYLMDEDVAASIRELAAPSAIEDAEETAGER